jgi:V/A-type H+-transporting ATPase subunit D
MERLPATRASLLDLEARRRVASKGRDLLRDKRGALARVFFELARRVLGGRERLDRCLREASRELTLARAIEGGEVLESLALAARREIPVDIVRQRVWGIATYAVKSPKLVRSYDARGGSPASWSLGAVTAARLHEEAVEILLEISTGELLLRRLGDEIRRTSRRINALEQVVLPKLEAEAARIALALAEAERADLLRLKRFKRGARERRSSPSGTISARGARRERRPSASIPCSSRPCLRRASRRSSWRGTR